MTSYKLSHLADQALLNNLATLVTQDRTTTALLLAHLAEVDERKLYRPAAYPSMYLYCVRELRMSEDTAYKRMRAARAARQFPAIFPAIADGRLHLGAVVLLAPHLAPETADELLADAAHRTKAEIELLLARRFPQPDVPTFVWAVDVPGASSELAAQPVGATASQLAPGPVVPCMHPNTPVQMEPLPLRTKPAPLSPGRFAVQFTMDEAMHEDLRQVQALLGHVLPSGDVAEVFRRALRELRQQLEKRKFAKCARPRPQRAAANGRHIPAAIRRAVCERDGGQCTFVSDRGKRCESRTRLEFDHIEPVARGGQATVAGLRLRCRTHNQYSADCTFGREFMDGKRQQSQEGAARAKAQVGSDEQGQAGLATQAANERDVTPWLRALGFNAKEARRGAEACAHIPDAVLEERTKVALRALAPHCEYRPAPSASCPA